MNALYLNFGALQRSLYLFSMSNARRQIQKIVSKFSQAIADNIFQLNPYVVVCSYYMGLIIF